MERQALPSRRPGIGLLMILLALVTAAIFIRVSSADFIDLDDGVYVIDNPSVLNGLTGDDVAWAWTTNHAGYWIPLTWLSLQLDATLTGPPPAAAPISVGENPANMVPPQTSAAIYHIDNLLEHICGSILLFLFLDRATKMRWPSFVVALLWAIHPLRVESVAWVTERKDVLAGIFGFLALYLYVLWTERRGWKLYAAMTLSFVLSLMAKPMFVTLPFILLLLDWWPLNRLRNAADARQRIVEKWVLFIVMIGGSLTAFFAQRSIHAVMTIDTAGIGQRLENSLLSYVRYLWIHVSVGRLGLFYPYHGHAAWWELLGAATLLAGVTGIAWYGRRSRPWLLAGWLWYLGSFVPMIGIVQSGEQAYADRFTYLPAVGLLIAVCFSVPTRWYAGAMKKWTLTGVAVLALVLGIFTVRQVEFWQDPVRLDQRTLAVTTSNYLIYSTLGATYMRKGNRDLATQCYEESIRINPDYPSARLGLGAIFLTMGRPDLAGPQLERAVFLDDSDAAAHNLFGIALASVGQLDAAIGEFSRAALLKPGDPQVEANMQRALAARAHQMNDGPATHP